MKDFYGFTQGKRGPVVAQPDVLHVTNNSSTLLHVTKKRGLAW